MTELALYVGGTIILLQQKTCEAMPQGVRGEVQSSEVPADDQAVGPSPQALSGSSERAYSPKRPVATILIPIASSSRSTAALFPIGSQRP